MKQIIIIILLSLCFFYPLHGNGVLILNNDSLDFLSLEETNIDVLVENQVATTISTQLFHNQKNRDVKAKYTFPLPVNATAIKLRYYYEGKWYVANFSPKPQSSITDENNNASYSQDFQVFLGPSPIIYELDQTLKTGSNIMFEITYVELLPYKNGMVAYSYPNNYNLIQQKPLEKTTLSFMLHSDRTIETLSLLSHKPDEIIKGDHDASLVYSSTLSLPVNNYQIQYSLNLEELGLFNMSTFLPDSLATDQFGSGFFAFIAEPDPGDNVNIINKVFTLIIDRSGSMLGSKMTQAKNAARFIIQHLNPVDKFNIISFSSDISSFKPEHVDYNAGSELDAINYIENLDASGSTFISGAFGKAIPQFSNVDQTTANIIIFFTDGEATSGLIKTDEIVEYVSTMNIQNEASISIFTFGIGNYTNEQLLTKLADQNGGICDFLKDNELESAITEFYLMIRNPVLMNTSVTFKPDIISEVYPKDFKNLYQGQQMILVGRYSSAEKLEAHFKGTAFSQEVSYTYYPQLCDSLNSQLLFLPKLWASKKIEKLMVDYYLQDQASSEAAEIKDQIIDISLKYGVISPFTSFQGAVADKQDDPAQYTLMKEWESESKNFDAEHQILVYPNPMIDHTTVEIKLKIRENDELRIQIIKMNGKVLKSYYLICEENNSLKLIIHRKDIPELVPGFYTIIVTHNNIRYFAKLMVL